MRRSALPNRGRGAVLPLLLAIVLSIFTTAGAGRAAEPPVPVLVAPGGDASAGAPGASKAPADKAATSSTLVIEDFNCPSANCLFTLNNVVQTDVWEGCALVSQTFPYGDNSTSWDDFNDYPAALNTDGLENGHGAQSLHYLLEGSEEDECNHTDQWAILYRSFTPFYGTCITIHFLDSYIIFKDEENVAEYPDVHLQVNYVGGGAVAARQTISSGAGWQTLTLNIDPTKAVELVLIAVGGPVSTQDIVLFDRLEVCDYSTSPPECHVSDTSIDFGVVEVGAYVDKSFTISNQGGGAVTGSVSEGCGHFNIIAGNGGYSLGAGESRLVTVRYNPASGGNHECTINLGSTTCGNVTCTGSTPPVCQVYPGTLSFGTVDVGEYDEKTFTVSNVGGGELGVFVDLSCGPFQVVTPDRNVSIPGGETDTFTVRYQPVDEAGDTCSIGLGTACDPVVMEGLGYIEPVCSIDPSALDFGVVELGSDSALTVTIANEGGSTLTGQLAASCGPFSVLDADRSYSLKAGQSKDFTVRFTPEDEGAIACTLSTASDYCDGIPLAGTGEAPPVCNLLPNTLRFDRVVVGDSADLSFTISNDGGGLVEGEVDGACGPFRVVDADRTYSLASGESKSFTVRFAPAAEESSACALATGIECGSLDVEGAGYVPAVCEIEPLTLDFGDVLIDTFALGAVTVRNAGGDRLAGALSLSCGGFSLDTADPSFDLAGGEVKTFTVRFAPPEEEEYSCDLLAGDSCEAVSLAGTGAVQPVCALSAPSLDFGIASVEETLSVSFSVRNAGTGILSGEVAAACGPFRVAGGDRSYSLGSGESKSFTVVFDPDSVDAYLCSLDVGLPCERLALSGVADPPPDCSVSPGAIDLGVVFLGETRTTTVTVTNAGGATLAGELGDGCGPFTVIDNDRTYSLGAGESRDFTVRFEPAGPGLFECDLPCGAPCGSIPIAGTGRDSCAIDVTAPEAGAFYTEGETRTISWNPGLCGGSVSIELLRDAVACSTIADSTANDGEFEWAVVHCGESGSAYAVRVARREQPVFDATSGEFTIDDAPGLELPDTMLTAELDPVAVSPASGRAFRIVNRGARDLHWTAAPSDEWVSLEVDSGAVAAGETLEVMVFLDPTTLPGGDTSAVVTLETDDPLAPTARIRVEARVRQYLPGDVTVNDVVDLVDLVRLRDHILDDPALFEAIVARGIADVNDDGAVDVGDLVALARTLSAAALAKPAAAPETGATLARTEGGAEIRFDDAGAVQAGLVEIEWSGGGEPPAPRALGRGGFSVATGDDPDSGRLRVVFWLDAARAAKDLGEPPAVALDWTGREGRTPRITGGALVVTAADGSYGTLAVAPGADALPEPGGTLFFAPSPNPAQAGTNLSFLIPRQERVRLSVYDAAGRLVRRVADETYAPGRHTLTWDGRDSAGREASNGVYFVRFEAAGEKISRKAVLLR